jgi:hypothetical protein
VQLTQGQAIILMAERGYARETARRLLLAGAAGPTLRIGNDDTYDADAVYFLAWRRPAEPEALQGPARRGVVVLRVSPPRSSIARQDHLLAMSGPWWMAWASTGELRSEIQQFGAVAAVLTMCNVVMAGGEIIDFRGIDSYAQAPAHRRRGSRIVLAVREPGAWFDALAERTIPLPPGSQWRWWPGRGPLRQGLPTPATPGSDLPPRPG